MIIFVTNQNIKISRNGFLYNAIKSKYNENVLLVNSSNKNAFIRNLTILFKVYSQFLDAFLNRRSVVFILGFQSRLLVPFIVPLRKIPTHNKSIFIYDFGYPIDQSFNISFLRKFIGGLIDKYSFNFDLITFESNSQLSYCSNKFNLFNKSNLATLYYLPVFYDSSALRNIKKDFIFRGVINDETNIKYILKEYGKYREKCFQSNIRPHKLIFFTRSNINHVDSGIIIDSTWYSDAELNYKIKSSVAMIGQMARNYRVNLTIPHKAFEACINNVIYICMRNRALSEIFDSEYLGYFHESLADKLFNLTLINDEYGNKIENQYAENLLIKSQKQLLSIWNIIGNIND